MFKKLGRMLKKGAMSVEYIVIGVCVIGMAVLATTFVSNKMSVAMGQENNAGDTNAGDNSNGNDSNDNVEVDPRTTLEYYGVCVGWYPATNVEVTENQMISYSSSDKKIVMAIFNYKDLTYKDVIGCPEYGFQPIKNIELKTQEYAGVQGMYTKIVKIDVKLKYDTSSQLICFRNTEVSETCK